MHKQIDDAVLDQNVPRNLSGGGGNGRRAERGAVERRDIGTERVVLVVVELVGADVEALVPELRRTDQLQIVPRKVRLVWESHGRTDGVWDGPDLLGLVPVTEGVSGIPVAVACGRHQLIAVREEGVFSPGEGVSFLLVPVRAAVVRAPQVVAAAACEHFPVEFGHVVDMNFAGKPATVAPVPRRVSLVVAIVAAGSRRVVVGNVQAAIAENPEHIRLLAADLIG